MRRCVCCLSGRAASPGGGSAAGGAGSGGPRAVPRVAAALLRSLRCSAGLSRGPRCSGLSQAVKAVRGSPVALPARPEGSAGVAELWLAVWGLAARRSRVAAAAPAAPAPLRPSEREGEPWGRCPPGATCASRGRTSEPAGTVRGRPPGGAARFPVPRVWYRASLHNVGLMSTKEPTVSC